MSRDCKTLLEAFEHLPAEEKRLFAEEVLRRSLFFDSGPVADEEIGAASAALFRSLEEEDASPKVAVRSGSWTSVWRVRLGPRWS